MILLQQPEYHLGIVLLDRLTLGAFITWAGVVKVRDRQSFRSALREFKAIPAPLAELASNVVPAMEVVLGASLFVGILVRFAAALSVIMLLVFTGVLALSLWRGSRPKCFCFGARSGFISMEHIVHNVVMLFLAAALFLSGQFIFSIDTWLMNSRHWYGSMLTSRTTADIFEGVVGIVFCIKIMYVIYRHAANMIVRPS